MLSLDYKVYQWNLATAWDIASGSENSTNFSVTGNPFGLVFKPDGTKFFTVYDGGSADEFEQYSGGKSCPDAHSATSALDAYTNVPTNTIFEQTDDTPSYWWYNGTSWLLDGTTTYDPSLFSTATGWSGDTSTWAYNSTLNGIGCDTSTLNEAVVKAIGKTLSKSGKWVARFKLTRNSGDLGDGVMLDFGSTSASTSTLAKMQAGNYP